MTFCFPEKNFIQWRGSFWKFYVVRSILKIGSEKFVRFWWVSKGLLLPPFKKSIKDLFFQKHLILGIFFEFWNHLAPSILKLCEFCKRYILLSCKVIIVFICKWKNFFHRLFLNFEIGNMFVGLFLFLVPGYIWIPNVPHLFRDNPYLL